VKYAISLIKFQDFVLVINIFRLNSIPGMLEKKFLPQSAQRKRGEPLSKDIGYYSRKK